MILTTGQMKQALLELKESIRRDVLPVLKAYRNKGYWLDENVPGFWTLPRMIFPEVDGLARLRYGNTSDNKSAKNAVKFMREYFPNPIYRLASGFIYHVYRHGLLHSHFPKQVIIGGRNRGWAVNFRTTGQETSLHLSFANPKLKEHLIIDGQSLFEDLLMAIDRYASEFGDPEKAPELNTNFRRAYESMNSWQPEAIFRSKSYFEASDCKFFDP